MTSRDDAGLPGMTPLANATVHRLDVSGATLHYEVRGTGPVVLVVGSPMASAEFASVADALAGDHTVVTYDPRGFGASTIADPRQESTPELRAEDLVAILDDLGVASADVVGSSGGAVTGLALAARYPGRVRTLIAHEPPLLELLPDADAQRTATDAIVATFHSDGPQAAWYAFMVNAGFDMSAEPGDGPAAESDPSEQEAREATRFFAHELQATTRYLPDIEALRAARVVVGIGAESARLVTHRTSTALAELLGSQPVIFPGEHVGFMSHPVEFAAAISRVLD
ncbi:alpha/beta fold hydrolase [Mycolicibacterium arseniciresistens]|uniref:Alpha/beta hydrolase n=1 Tax=Mycolicibacterium arseniciresistens TaxID=3062257 RepID=A0ABT8UGR3_9MYCO|nr:alpha/beta hydrolase [Mycolicibacterium arseniciresistens]MDO3636963.1 alpha/beta hydrolase [Mycolicibacterium arseniciresistens]